MNSSTGKKAILDTLDPAIASLKSRSDDKPHKQPKEKKEKDPKDEALKELQKDIKAFLVSSCERAQSKRLAKYHSETFSLDYKYIFIYTNIKIFTLCIYDIFNMYQS